jgi:hypothetical protein
MTRTPQASFLPHVVLLFVFSLVSCVPNTTTTPAATSGETGGQMTETTPTLQPQASCPFALTLDDTYSVLSSTVAESEASYQVIEPERSLLSEVKTQLEAQGWTQTETTSNKATSSSETLFTCTQGGTLRVTYGPVGKSLIYALRLTLE